MAETRVGLLYRRAATRLAGLAALLLAASPAFADLDVREYVNAFTGHFFLAASMDDVNAVESGAAGPGWQQTAAFSSYSSLVGFSAAYPDSQAVPVYRFYAPGPNSHFYTADPVELAAVRAPGSGWIEEGYAFRMDVPVDGACPLPQIASVWIHRLYNDRFAYNDSAHRWVFNDTVRASMVANGWIDEGVVFCAGAGAMVSPPYTVTFPASMRTSADCENESVNRGHCLGLSELPSLPNEVVSRAPPYTYPFVGLVPDSANNYDLYTAQPIGDLAAVSTHTYVKNYYLYQGSPTGEVELHVSNLDAQASLASIDPVYQFTTGAPARGQVDLRVFPWANAAQNQIEVTFSTYIPILKRADAQSHGYGNLLIEFKDATSGQSIDVTVAAYGTIPQGDFVSINDPSTGNVWVSTTFGKSMLFGTNRGSSFIPCDGSGQCRPSNSGAFDMLLSSADFSNIIGRARALNPALSTKPSDYMLVKYFVRNGILGNAEVAVSLGSVSLSLLGH